MAGLRTALGAAKYVNAAGQDVTAATLRALQEKCPEALGLFVHADVYPRCAARRPTERGGACVIVVYPHLSDLSPLPHSLQLRRRNFWLG